MWHGHGFLTFSFFGVMRCLDRREKCMLSVSYFRSKKRTLSFSAFCVIPDLHFPVLFGQVCEKKLKWRKMEGSNERERRGDEECKTLMRQQRSRNGEKKETNCWSTPVQEVWFSTLIKMFSSLILWVSPSSQCRLQMEPIWVRGLASSD